MLLKFSTLAGGVFIEQVAGDFDYLPTTRCFRFDAQGNAEFAYYACLKGDNPAPRWFGHAFKEKDFVFA